jgi:hypothetical protein
MAQNDNPPSDDRTIPARSSVLRRFNKGTPELDQSPPASAHPSRPIPALLEPYFQGEIDLNRELSARYPHMPLMSLIHFGMVGVRRSMAIAAISTQDGAASLTVEVDPETKGAQFTFSYSSMLALRFTLGKLNDRECAQWLDEMRQERAEPAFLWDAARWERDYLLTFAQKHYTSVFAFSPLHVEAAARLTSDVSHKLLDWLGDLWRVE